MLKCSIFSNREITMAKPNHLSVPSKISYALSSYMGRLIATKEIKDNLLSFFFSREYMEIALCNISGFTIPLAIFLIQNNIKVSYIIDSAKGGGNSFDIQIYKPDRWDIPSVDAIIVLPHNKEKHRKTYIRKTIEKLDKYISCPIYSVFDLFIESAPIKTIKKNYIFYRDLDPKYYAQELSAWYKRQKGRELNLENPITFSEKMQWLKLYDNIEIKTKLSDKYAVREWIKGKIGESYLIPLLGTYDKPEEINYDSLPNEFVIKCNHGSGMNIVVKDKDALDKQEIAEKLNIWISQNYAFRHGAGLELNYKNIIPKIIIEKKLENKSNEGMINYRFWCFNGSVKFIQYHTDQYFTENRCEFFSLSWEKLGFAYNHPLIEANVERPVNLETMISVAKTLCAELKFVRVDLYCLNDGIIYFSEMTFYPALGVGKWVGKDMDEEFGKYIVL